MVNHHPHRHFHLIDFSLSKQLSQFYMFIFISSLAASMIGIFIPLYLLKELGLSFVKVMSFYIVVSAVFAFSASFIAKFSSKIGFKKSILISIPLIILFYILLYSLEFNPFLLYFVAVLMGMAHIFFWIPFHASFSKFSDRKHRGEEVGVWYSLAILFGIVGPLLGSLILTYFSFSHLFLIVSALYFSSTVPLFFSKEIYGKGKFSCKAIFKKRDVKDKVSFVAYGVRNSVAAIFWPVFIFYVLGHSSYLKLGSIISIAAVFTMILSFVIGKISDQHKKRKLIKLGSIFDSIVWFTKIFGRTFFQFLGLSILSGIAYVMIDVPFMAKVYDKAKKKKPIEYLAFREIFLHSGKVLFFSLALLIALFISKLEIILMIGFIIAGIASLFHMLYK